MPYLFKLTLVLIFVLTTHTEAQGQLKKLFKLYNCDLVLIKLITISIYSNAFIKAQFC